MAVSVAALNWTTNFGIHHERSGQCSSDRLRTSFLSGEQDMCSLQRLLKFKAVAGRHCGGGAQSEPRVQNVAASLTRPENYRAKRRRTKTVASRLCRPSRCGSRLGKDLHCQHTHNHVEGEISCEAFYSGERASETQLNANEGLTRHLHQEPGTRSQSHSKLWREDAFDPLGLQPLCLYSSSDNGLETKGDSPSTSDENAPRAVSTSGNDTSKTSLSSLDAYFEKLNATKASTSSNPAAGESPSASSSNDNGSRVEASQALSDVGLRAIEGGSGTTTSQGTSSASIAENGQNVPKAAKALKSLDAYFDKLRPPPPPPPPPAKEESPAVVAAVKENVPKDIDTQLKEQFEELPPEIKNNPRFQEIWKDIVESMNEISQHPGDDAQKSMQRVQQVLQAGNQFQDWLTSQKEEAAPWVVNLLVTLNIAVYILELGSPELEPNNIMSTLPSLYMAKVNQLILDGEWWRLVTPSFLHSGFLHLVVSVWTLWTLGRPVEIALGPLGMLGAFLVGGASGNLLSFFAGDQIAVGGTGPIYGLVGAWIVFLVKNRSFIGKEWADGEVWKVAFLAGLNLLLGSPPPIDDWTHIGGFIGGAFYAALASPRLIRVVQKKVDSSEMRPKNLNLDYEDVGFIASGPGVKQHLWIYALCTGILVAIYLLGTQSMPKDLGIGPGNLFI